MCEAPRYAIHAENAFRRSGVYCIAVDSDILGSSDEELKGWIDW
jgi:hypothetical protein